MILARAGQIKQLSHMCTWKFSVIEVSWSFLEFIVIIDIFILRLNLFATLWIISEFENVWKSVAQLPALVDLQMQFSVIGVFSLDDGRTFLSTLDSTNFTSTTEQVRHLTSLTKVLLVPICETGKSLLCVSGMF